MPFCVAMPSPVSSAKRRYAGRRSRGERREQLLDAALAVADSEGFSRLTVEAVAREAGLAKTVIYDVIGNQTDLHRALIEREQRRAIAAIAEAMPELPPAGHPIEVLTAAMTSLLEAVRRDEATWRLILLPPHGAPPLVRELVDEHRERVRRQLEPIVAWGLDRLGATDLDPELATHALLATIEQAARLAVTDPERYTAERLAAFAGALLGHLAD